MHRVLKSMAILAAVCGIAPFATAATIGVTVGDASSGNYNLTSLSVTRGSAGTFTYLPERLTGVTLTDVDSYQLPLLVSRGAALPEPGTRASLLEDHRLDTGVINTTTTNAPADRSFEITFDSPVMNAAGEDIILFEVGGDDGIRFWINNDRDGQMATLTTSSYSAALLTNIPTTLYQYANGTDLDVNSLAELESPSGYTLNSNSTADIHAIGLDLSLLGVPLGGSVDSIRFQSVAGAGGRLDPVMVLGLPPVPEPTTALALAAVGSALLRRHHR